MELALRGWGCHQATPKSLNFTIQPPGCNSEPESLASLDACKAKCDSEPQCRYIAFDPSEACSRYSGDSCEPGCEARCPLGEFFQPSLGTCADGSGFGGVACSCSEYADYYQSGSPSAC